MGGFDCLCLWTWWKYILGNLVDIQWLRFINKWHFTGSVPQAQITSCLKQNLLLSWWSPSVHPWLQLPASPQTQRACQDLGSFQCRFSEKRKKIKKIYIFLLTQTKPSLFYQFMVVTLALYYLKKGEVASKEGLARFTPRRRGVEKYLQSVSSDLTNAHSTTPSFPFMASRRENVNLAPA